MAKQKTVKVNEDLNFRLHCNEVTLNKGLWINPEVGLKIPKGSDVIVIQRNKETIKAAIEYDNFSFEFTLPNKIFE